MQNIVTGMGLFTIILYGTGGNNESKLLSFFGDTQNKHGNKNLGLLLKKTRKKDWERIGKR